MPDMNFNNNLFTFGSNGKLTNNDTVWEDLRVPVNGVKLAGLSDPQWVKLIDDGLGSTGVYAYHFDDTTEEEVFFSLQMPHAWKLGTSISPHVHCSPTTTNAGNIGWGLEYGWANYGSALPANSTIITGTVAAATVINEHQICSLTDIVMTGGTLSTMMLCRLFRDTTGVDTHTGDVALWTIDFHYEVDSMGSASEFSK